MVVIYLLLAIALYTFLTYVFDYWKRRDVPYLKPTIPVGNMEAFVKQKSTFGVTIANLYDKSTLPFVGIFTFLRPAILVRDPELVKRVLVTDFEHFHDRGMYSNPEREPISANLFAMKGQSWKIMRQKLSPLFSSGKLRLMFPTFLREAEALDKYIESHQGKVLEFKDLLLRYTLDMIGSVFYGIEVDTINNPTHEFKRMHAKVANPGIFQNMGSAVAFLVPGIFDMFKLPPFPPYLRRFFMRVVGDTINCRQNNNIRRNDFIQHLIDMMKAENELNAADKDNLTVASIVGNAFLFFMAGTETSSGAAGLALYELARAPEILEKLVLELDHVLSKTAGEITYDAIQDMKYLDLVLKETLRKYPGLPMIQRECTKDFRIPGTKTLIEKGTSVLISVLGLQMDPQYFRNPEQFIPERFEKGNENYNQDAYMPFGGGPHVCIAVRFGYVVVKLAIVKILSKYRIEAVDNNKIEFDNSAITLIPKGGINLRVCLR